jgi:hypothetical protein
MSKELVRLYERGTRTMALGEQIGDSHILVPLSSIGLTTSLSVFSLTAFQ